MYNGLDENYHCNGLINLIKNLNLRWLMLDIPNISHEEFKEICKYFYQLISTLHGVLINAPRYSIWKEFGFQMAHHAHGAIFYNIKHQVSIDIKSFKPQNSILIHNNTVNTNPRTRYLTDDDLKVFDKITNRFSSGISEKFILDWF
jgi:hypothetical protein